MPPWLAILLSVTLILVFGEVLHLLPKFFFPFRFTFFDFEQFVVIVLLLSICR